MQYSFVGNEVVKTSMITTGEQQKCSSCILQNTQYVPVEPTWLARRGILIHLKFCLYLETVIVFRNNHTMAKSAPFVVFNISTVLVYRKNLLFWGKSWITYWVYFFFFLKHNGLCERVAGKKTGVKKFQKYVEVAFWKTKDTCSMFLNDCWWPKKK